MNFFSYDNIGEKIKGWAKWVFIIGAISSAVAAIVLMASAEDAAVLIIGIIMLIVGPLVSWVSSWLLYGFGEVIDTLDVIAYNTYREKDDAPDNDSQIPQDNHTETTAKHNDIRSQRMSYFAQQQR